MRRTLGSIRKFLEGAEANKIVAIKEAPTPRGTAAPGGADAEGGDFIRFPKGWVSFASKALSPLSVRSGATEPQRLRAPRRKNSQRRPRGISGQSLVLLTLLALRAQAASTCTWCVLGNSRATRAALTLASEETPKKMLEKVRAEGIAVKILNSGRPVPKNFFHWGSLERAVAPLESLSQLKGVMGKTLCKGEHPLAADGTTIFLASDAPKSTLIHEYLHTFQIQGDPAWCPISKAIWDTGRMSREAMILMQDREWDVHRWLWENRDALKLAVEDRVNIGANLMDQASARAPRDPSVRVYLKKHKVNEELDRDVVAYRKALGLPR